MPKLKCDNCGERVAVEKVISVGYGWGPEAIMDVYCSKGCAVEVLGGLSVRKWSEETRERQKSKACPECSSSVPSGQNGIVHADGCPTEEKPLVINGPQALFAKGFGLYEMQSVEQRR